MAVSTQRLPTWLSTGGFAAKLFQSDSPPALGGIGQSQQNNGGRSHLPMAVRGNEIFYVVDKSIRWADLSKTKEQAETPGSGPSNMPGSGYRVLNIKRSFSEPIQQLIISPNEELMAIVTRHSVCVIILPDTSLLNAGGSASIGVRRHTIGETTHVRETSPIAKILWHPLGVDGNCLVTITESAVVRLWELDRRNLGSFSIPSLAIDLRKLRHAQSQEEDVGAKDMRSNHVFSIDNIEMEVTAACFGSNAAQAQAFEWSAATLWLTMAEGDIFALCPLLPSRFQPDDDGTISTLFELKTAQKKSFEGNDSPGIERARVEAQCMWLGELQEQYDNFEESDTALRRLYYRPRSQGAIPSLQGPFVILPNQAQDDLVPCDIHVVGASTAASIVNHGEPGFDFDEGSDAGASFSTVSILDENGRVYICIDIDGVEPQWLPSRPNRSRPDDTTGPSELLLFEALDTLTAKDAGQGYHPVITPNASADEYSFFVSHAKGVYRLSLQPWIQELEKEVQSVGTQGVQFRAQVLAKSAGTLRERIYRPDSKAITNPISAPVLVSTEELGHLLLTVQGQQPHAVMFSPPGDDEEPEQLTWRPGYDPTSKIEPETKQTREVYHPPQAFTQPSSLPNFIDSHIDPRHRRLAKEEIRLSSASLSIMTEAHRILSRETTALNDAAADLFRRCDRLHDEFKHQIERMAEIADRAKAINEADSVDGSAPQSDRKRDIEDRLSQVQSNQTRLIQRHDEMRQKLARAGGKPLSGKERVWVAEVTKIEAAVGDEEAEGVANSDARQQLAHRFKEVQRIAIDMLERAREERGESGSETTSLNGHGHVPPDVRRGKVAEVEEMLERQTALIDTALSKMARLGVSGEA